MSENDQTKKTGISSEAMQEQAPTSELNSPMVPKSEEPTVAASSAVNNTMAKTHSSSLRGEKLLTVLLAFVAGFLIFTSGVLMGLAIGDASDHGGQGMYDNYMPQRQGPPEVVN